MKFMRCIPFFFLILGSSFAFTPRIQTVNSISNCGRIQSIPQLNALPAASDLVYSPHTFSPVLRDGLGNIAVWGLYGVGFIAVFVLLLQQLIVPYFVQKIVEIFLQENFPEFWENETVPLFEAEGKITENFEVIPKLVTRFIQVESPEVWEEYVAGELKPGETLWDRPEILLKVVQKLEDIADEGFDEFVEENWDREDL